MEQIERRIKPVNQLFYTVEFGVQIFLIEKKHTIGVIV